MEVRIQTPNTEAVKAHFKSLKDFDRELKKAIQAEARRLAGKITQRIKSNTPPPLSPLTLAARRMRGFRGTKTLVVNGDLMGAPTFVSRGNEAFVGVLATSRRGAKMADIAAIHEHGATIVLQITPRMRRYLGALMREAGVAGSGSKKKGTGIIVIKIPARPFIKPVFDAAQEESPQRIMNTIAHVGRW